MLFKLSILDPTTKRLVLEQLIEQVESSLEDLLKLGLDPELLDSLRNRPVRDFLRAGQMSTLELSVELDEGNLRYVFMRTVDERRDQSLREYFVKNGASTEILNRLFKMSRDEIAALRDLLTSNPRTGRPPLPSQFEREDIHRAWDKIVKVGAGQPTRESLYQLHQLFSSHSISALWQVVNEFGAIDTVPARPVRAAGQGVAGAPSAWHAQRPARSGSGDGAPLSA